MQVGPEARSNDPCELFPTGRNQDPSVMLMADCERFALGQDEKTTFIDLDGKMSESAVKWGETPLSVANDPPYLLAVLSKCVEVRTDEPRLNIQVIELPRPRFVCTPTPSVAESKAPHGVVYVASQSHIWCLRMVPVSMQVPQLVQDKQFELASTLSNIGGGTLEKKNKSVQEIQTLSAFHRFCTFKFKEAMDIFYQLDVDTSHVVGLVADLLPEHHRDKLSYPDRLPDLQGKERENAMLALIEYLTKVSIGTIGIGTRMVQYTCPCVGSQQAQQSACRPKVHIASSDCRGPEHKESAAHAPNSGYDVA